MMQINLLNYTVADWPLTTSLRCPSCGRLGSFEVVISLAIVVPTDQNRHYYLTQRKCPNPTCRAHVFVVLNQEGSVVESFPPERIDFDPQGIPQNIIASFEEALTCHANGAYIAASIMIRRTLEEICADANVEGNNLQERIKSLSKTVILPPDLLKGLDNLRLLGNDAAHVEAEEYDQIGKDEVELAAAVVKEVLKARYQLKDLVARLEGLRKKASP